MNDIDRFKPLSDASSALEIENLEISNDENALSIAGNLTLTPDQESIERARSLAKLLTRTADALEAAMAQGKTAFTKQSEGKDEFGLPA